MKLISWNVNGIRACLTKGFENFFKEVDADIFCLQETKCQPDQVELEFEGYSTEEATYAVNNCGANWKEQAVRVAKNYLNTMSFSKQSLITQLEFEGFTEEEAQYGVEQAYK